MSVGQDDAIASGGSVAGYPKVVPLLLGLGLFFANSAAIISGWVGTPDGYVHLLHVDADDSAIYEGWLRSSRDRFLHPNFQAPWVTEPAVVKPLFFLIAQASTFSGITLDWGWFLTHLVLYVVTAYALFAAVWTFMKSRVERWMALLAMMLTVPVPSLLVLPSAVLPLHRLGVPPLPGVGSFVWTTSDGFLHGISASILVTYGTAATIAAFWLLARYLETERVYYLVGSGICVLLCGLVHPYEPFLIVTAGSLALTIWQWPHVRRAVPMVAALGTFGALGLVPMTILALTTPWVRDTAAITQWAAPNPAELPIILGVPATVAIVLLLLRPRMKTATDVLLQCWVVVTLVGIYLPFLPWTQHLLDGFHYAVAMLLIRQVTQIPSISDLWAQHRRMLAAGVGTLVVLSVPPYLAYYSQSWIDGRRPEPQRLFRAVVRADDVRAREWLAENGRHSDLVLAPVDRATWFSSVPMHSFAGNSLFSITFKEQSRLSSAFFSGNMNRDAAEQLLSGYGVRWVVVPSGSPALNNLAQAGERARFGDWTIFEIEGPGMKPYPGLPR